MTSEPKYTDVPVVVEGVLSIDVGEWNAVNDANGGELPVPAEDIADYMLKEVVGLTILDRDIAIPVSEVETGRALRTSVVMDRLRLAQERVARVDAVIGEMRAYEGDGDDLRHWIERLDAALSGGHDGD